jgi:hypothetical protein
MSAVNQFSQRIGSNQVVSPASSSAQVVINQHDKAVRLVNSGANICYVRISAGAATTADIPVRANSEIIVRKSTEETLLSYISASGTTLNVATGEGGI